MVHECDLGRSKSLERVERFGDAGVDCTARDPCLVLLAVHATSFDDAKTNVDNVDIIHLVAGAACKGCAGEQADDESIEASGGVPIGSHALPVGFAIFGRCSTVLVDEPEKKINEDDVGLAETTLLE